MKLDVEMKCAVIAAVGRCLMQRHYVRERHLPEIVETNQSFAQDFRKIRDFRVRKVCQTRMRFFWRDVNFVSITRKIRQKSDCRFVFGNNSSAIPLFSSDNVLKKMISRFAEMPRAC